MIILVVIVVGVVILVVLFRAKRRKQKFVLSQLQNVTVEKEDSELKLKQEETTRREDSEQPLYAVVQKKVQSTIPSRSEDVKYLNQNSTLSEYKLVPAESEYAVPAKFPTVVSLSNPMFEEMESNPMYQSMDQCCDPPCTTYVPQGNEVYTVPDIISSHTVETQSGIHETVYSKPIQPSLFTDAVENPSDSDVLQPYAPIH